MSHEQNITNDEPTEYIRPDRITEPIAVFQEDLNEQVDGVVQDKLAKANITEYALAALKEEASTLPSVITNDAELKRVQGIITKATNMRTTAVRICEQGRRPAIMLQKAWISREKEVVSMISSIEEPLKALKQAYIDEQDRKEAEELKRREEEKVARYMALQDIGFTRVMDPIGGDYFILAGTHIKVSDIDTYEAAAWAITLKQAEIVAGEERDRKEAEAKRHEEERIAREEAERKLREQQEELDRKMEQMRQMQLSLRKAKLAEAGCEYIPSMSKVAVIHGNEILFSLHEENVATMSEEQFTDELLAAKLAVEDKKVREQKAKEFAEQQARHAERLRKINDRHERLKAAGWLHYDTEEPYMALLGEDGSVIKSVIYDGDQGIAGVPDEYIDQWVSMGEEVKAEVRAREEAAQAERIRQAELKRIEEERIAKEKAEADRKAQMSDAQKWEEWKAAIIASAPSMESAIGQHGVKRVLQGLEAMTPGLLADLNK